MPLTPINANQFQGIPINKELSTKIRINIQFPKQNTIYKEKIVGLKNIIRKVLLESYQDENEEESLTFYKALRQYIKGNITDYELTGFDDMIKSVSHRSGHRGQASIIFDFDNDYKLFEILELDEDDGWFARVITGGEHGDGWDFIDYYQAEEDFKEGYTIFGELDDDNVEKMEDILLFLTGKKTDIRNNDNEDNAKIANLLITSFPDEMDDIVRDYRYERNYEMNAAAKESVISELNTFLENIGFNLHRDFDLISTTPGNLLMWYSRTGRKELNFEELFKLIIQQTNTSNLGGWYEDTYQFHNSDYFDKDGFNREVERQLDKILEKIESEDINFEEFKNLISTVTKKYNIGRWYSLPKNEKYDFKIDGFDIQNMKIRIHARNKKSWRAKPLLLSLESFNNLLYTPELFDLSDLIPENRKR